MKKFLLVFLLFFLNFYVFGQIYNQTDSNTVRSKQYELTKLQDHLKKIIKQGEEEYNRLYPEGETKELAPNYPGKTVNPPEHFEDLINWIREYPEEYDLYLARLIRLRNELESTLRKTK